MDTQQRERPPTRAELTAKLRNVAGRLTGYVDTLAPVGPETDPQVAADMARIDARLRPQRERTLIGLGVQPGTVARMSDQEVSSAMVLVERKGNAARVKREAEAEAKRPAPVWSADDCRGMRQELAGKGFDVSALPDAETAAFYAVQFTGSDVDNAFIAAGYNPVDLAPADVGALPPARPPLLMERVELLASHIGEDMQRAKAEAERTKARLATVEQALTGGQRYDLGHQIAAHGANGPARPLLPRQGDPGDEDDALDDADWDDATDSDDGDEESRFIAARMPAPGGPFGPGADLSAVINIGGGMVLRLSGNGRSGAASLEIGGKVTLIDLPRMRAAFEAAAILTGDA
jgi:hypothetical protein